jgi:hypothetical protein
MKQPWYMGLFQRKKAKNIAKIGDDTWQWSKNPRYYTAKTKYRNLETNIPRKGISGSRS